MTFRRQVLDNFCKAGGAVDIDPGERRWVIGLPESGEWKPEVGQQFDSGVCVVRLGKDKPVDVTAANDFSVGVQVVLARARGEEMRSNP